MKKQKQTEALVHTGQLLRKYVNQKRINQAGWARQQGVNATTIAQYLKNPDMRIGTLIAISQTLNHNFLQDIASLLPAQMPHTPNTLDEKLAALEKENEKLKTENELLKGLLGRG